MTEKEFDETQYSIQCNFYRDFIKVIDNELLAPLLDGHPLRRFGFEDCNNIYIECSCGKKANITPKEMLYILCDIKEEKLEKDSFIMCKEGNGHKKYNFYSVKLKRNLCDECLGKEELRSDDKELFNFDNNYHDYYEMGTKVEEKIKKDEKDELIPPEIKKSFDIIFSIFLKNYNDFSLFKLIEGFYSFFILSLPINSNLL